MPGFQDANLLAILSTWKPDPAKKYLQEQANNYFWRTYSQKEIDLVEERDGKLSGYEMKWGAAPAKPPREWLAAYLNATWQLINRQNYLELIT